jgi:hypothetical protein
MGMMIIHSVVMTVLRATAYATTAPLMHHFALFLYSVLSMNRQE